jgi:hypothetical protein
MNWKLILNIVSSINGGLITGAALLQTLIGQDLTIKVVAALGVCQIIISSVNSQLSTQVNQIASVAAIPGVSRVAINEQASPAIAQAATDPAQPKVGPATPELRSVLNTIAKSAA